MSTHSSKSKPTSPLVNPLDAVPLQTKSPSPQPTPPPQPMEEEEAATEGEQTEESEGNSEEESDKEPVDSRPLADKNDKVTQQFTVGFYLDNKWLEKTQFIELKEILEGQSWMKLFTIGYKDVMIPTFMDDFCKNFRYDDGVVISKIRGDDVIFDARALAEIFDVPNSGYADYFKRENKISLKGVSKSKMLKFLGGTGKSNVINHNNLSPIHKLLFNIVWRAIVPRTQHRNEANLLDCTLIYCMANRIQINFPSIMLQHLAYTVPRNFKVGYGALLTKIFKSFVIPGFRTVPVVRMGNDNILGEVTMTSLKLKVEGGKAVEISSRRGKEVQRGSSEESKGTKRATGPSGTKGKAASGREQQKRRLSPTRKSTRRRRFVKKQKTSSVPIDLSGEESSSEEEETVPVSTKGTAATGESSPSTEQQLRMIFIKLMDVENAFKSINEELASVKKQLEASNATMAENHKAILEKIDSITVEDVEDPPVPSPVP